MRTDSGDITFASNFFLKIGSEITIRIEHIAGSNSAHILTVNGQPPEVAVLQSGFAPDPEIIVSDNLKPSIQQSPQQSQPNISASNSGVVPSPSPAQSPTITVTGTIISQANEQNIQQNTQLQPLPVGSQLSLKIVSLAQPPSAQAQTPAAAITQSPATENNHINNNANNNINTQNAAAPSPSTQAPATAPTVTQSQAPYAAYVRTSSATPISVQTPEVSAPVIQPQTLQAQPGRNQLQLQNPAQISATVISNDPNGEAIVNSPLGIIRLQSGTQLPIGSHVAFEISEIKTPEMLQNAANIMQTFNTARAPAPLTELARSPGALGNIFTLLSGLNTQDAQDFLARSIPTIGQPQTFTNTGYNSEAAQSHNLLSSIFNYASAIGSGDFRSWLGKNNAKWLEDNGHEDLLKKAEGEFASVARQYTDAPPRSWQSLFFPIALGGELQQARLFVKRDRKQKDTGNGATNEEDTRFVVEMDLTQLGEMQMDGFVRNNNKSIQFDLIIRSNMALSQEIQKDILDIYNNIGELTGYHGALSFQTVREFPVNPMEEIISADHEGIVA